MTKKILFVDDDQNVLNSYQRHLGFEYEIDTALGGEAGLSKLEQDGPYAVVISDMRMPNMDGTRFLSEVSRRWPESVRMLLTGHADMSDTIAVVNEGNIYRFLTKPCPPETFARALNDAIELYTLRSSEKELLHQTLKGSIKVLMDVASTLNPAVFKQSQRVKELAHKIAVRVGVKNLWQVDLATLLSRIGYVTLPPNILDKKLSGARLSAADEKQYLSYVERGYELIKNIPRLQEVARAILYQEKKFNGDGPPQGSVRGQQIPVLSRILKIVYDFDELVASGADQDQALKRLLHQKAFYDSDIYDALKLEVLLWDDSKTVKVAVGDLKIGAVLAENVKTNSGILLAARNQEVSSTLLMALTSNMQEGNIPATVLVFEEQA